MIKDRIGILVGIIAVIYYVYINVILVDHGLGFVIDGKIFWSNNL